MPAAQQPAIQPSQQAEQVDDDASQPMMHGDLQSFTATAGYALNQTTTFTYDARNRLEYVL